MPIAGTARSFSGAHVTSGYDASGRRASNRKSSENMNQRKNRRGGRK